MQIKMKINADFKKLSRQIPKIVKEHLVDYVKSVERDTKLNIDNSTDVNGRFLNRQYKTGQPLIETGTLFNSLESKGNKLTVAKHGYHHDTGEYKHLRAGTYVKNFIGINTKSDKILDNKFSKKINRALSK